MAHHGDWGMPSEGIGEGDGPGSDDVKLHSEAATDARKSRCEPLDPKQVVSFKELLISQRVQQEALAKLLVENGVFTKEEISKEEFFEVVKLVDRELKKKRQKNLNQLM